MYMEQVKIEDEENVILKNSSEQNFQIKNRICRVKQNCEEYYQA